MQARVENFQSIADAVLTIEGLTVVLGPSDVGKSALIRALGATFFNRPGDNFVRLGEKNATVTVTGAPKAGGGVVDVAWSKGQKPAHYTINGESYGKVGAGTPDVLRQAGYRDVSLRDRDMRPQVAGQFDAIFLLEDSGAVMADVLAAASRIDVFARAVDLCAGDNRAVQSALVVLRKQVVQAEVSATAATDALTPWIAAAKTLVIRAEALQTALDQAQRAAAVFQRYHAAGLVSRPLPFTVTPPAVPPVVRMQRLAQVYVTAQGVPAPHPSPVCTLPTRASQQRLVASARTVLTGVATPTPAPQPMLWTRPASVVARARLVLTPVPNLCPVPPPLAWDRPTRLVGATRRWVVASRVQSPVRVSPLPDTATVVVVRAEQQFRARDVSRDAAEAAHTRAVHDVHAATAALDAFKTSNPWCPSCLKPW